MKKIYLLIFLLLLSGCVHYNIEAVRPNEMGMQEDLYGKIFTIDCESSWYSSSKYIDKECRFYISEFAYKNGYNYFTVLDSGSKTQTSTGNYTTITPVNTYYRNSNGTVSSSTTYVPQNNTYNIATNYSYYMFLLINKDEIGKWKNYYKVEDYYNPEDPKRLQSKIRHR